MTSKRESKISFENAQRLNESGYNKAVRINVPKQIPKQTAKLTVVQNTMKKKLTP